MKTEELLQLLRDQHYTLSCMESLTGGLLGATFTQVPGASDVFKGSLVAYQDEIKEKAGVKMDTILEEGAISDKCAKEMAIAASNYFNSDIAIALTGNAGPDPSEDKPVGLVYCAIKIDNRVSIFKMQLSGDRETIRKMAVEFALSALYKKIDTTDESY